MMSGTEMLAAKYALFWVSPAAREERISALKEGFRSLKTFVTEHPVILAVVAVVALVILMNDD